MHAYLFVGGEISNIKSHILDLSEKLHAKEMKYPLQKIEDVRSLNNLIRLSFDEPTLIVSENIDEATEEALNAFLKSLEEPQENIYFALTALTTRKVLPTIVSRCEIIKIPEARKERSFGEIENFTELSTGKKLALVDKIKGRDEAKEFTENLVNYYHGMMHQKETKNLKTTAENAKNALQTLGKIKANGNVSLSLTNLVINLT